MKRSITAAIAAFSAAVLLCGCSQVKRQTTSDTDSVQNGTEAPTYEFIPDPDYSQTSMYLDESDLTSEGNVKFNIFTDYEFPDGDAPELDYEKRTSPDGEEFYYDSEKTLCYYRNTDSIYNKKDQGETTLSTNNLNLFARDFIGAFVGAKSNDLTATIFPENVYSVVKDDGTGDAVIRYDNDGDIRYVLFNYDIPTSTPDESYFSGKLDDAVKASGDKENARAVRYAQLDGRIYALFTVELEAEDGTKHTGMYGFSKELS